MTAATKSIAVAEREEPLLEFLLLKKLDYRKRMRVVLILAVVGLLLQALFLNVWPGVPLLLAALLLAWVVGFDNKVDFQRFHRGASWESVSYERLMEIVSIDRRMRKWDESLWDISSLQGGVLCLVSIGFVALVTFALWQASHDLAIIFGTDCILLLVFQWVNGMRRIHRQPTLVLKAAHLVAASGNLGDEDLRGGKLGAQLLVHGDEEENMPMGAKVAVTWPDGPDWFYGVQCQVVINRVQGKPYPYCYAVLVGKQGHDLIESTNTPKPSLWSLN